MATLSPTGVLVIEDDAVIRRELVARINADAELVVRAEAATVRGAQLAIEAADVRLALLDLHLPDGSGLQLLPAARARAIDVLILTISDADANVFGALAAGASGYLLKADALATVNDSLKDLRDGGSPISPRIARRLVAELRTRKSDERLSEEAALLTVREREVIDLFCRGATYAEVAQALGISINTVRQHVRKIYDKLHVSSKAEAVVALKRLQGT
jgi:RNA polymerase sigma factor (sigma-70 family)